MKRFYLVDKKATSLDLVRCSDEEFMNEAESQGLVYENFFIFQKDFNYGIFAKDSYSLRILEPSNNLGGIYTKTCFLFLPLEINGVRKWWTRETYTYEIVWNSEYTYPSIRHLNWGPKN